MSRILVTGANGFVGRAVCAALAAAGHEPVGAVRSEAAAASLDPERMQCRIIGDVHEGTDWTRALEGIDAVIHLAARVHVMRDQESDPLAAFCRVNLDGTLRLAEQAFAAGAGRLVYASTVKVHGESTSERPFTEQDPLAPQDPYAQSKARAEEALLALAKDKGREVALIRPPLVHGPGVRANFLRLLRWVDRQLPLPLSSVRNQRSLVALDNLADALALCATHPAAANRAYLVSDGPPLSTPDLLRALAELMGRRTRLLPMPAPLLKAMAACLGKSKEAKRLLGSLAVDDSRIRSELGWRQPLSPEQGLAKTVQWYLERS